jgi:hypothetical protein
MLCMMIALWMLIPPSEVEVELLGEKVNGVARDAQAEFVASYQHNLIFFLGTCHR